LAAIEPFSRTELEQRLGIALDRPVLLVTYHPATLAADADTGLTALLDALDGVPAARLVVTGTNADTAGRRTMARLKTHVEARRSRAVFHTSLGTKLYLSVLREADAVVGNS